MENKRKYTNVYQELKANKIRTQNVKYTSSDPNTRKNEEHTARNDYHHTKKLVQIALYMNIMLINDNSYQLVNAAEFHKRLHTIDAATRATNSVKQKSKKNVQNKNQTIDVQHRKCEAHSALYTNVWR